MHIFCLLPTIVWCVYLMSWFSFLFLLLALRAPWAESPNKILKTGNILAQLQFAQNTKAQGNAHIIFFGQGYKYTNDPIKS